MSFTIGRTVTTSVFLLIFTVVQPSASGQDVRRPSHPWQGNYSGSFTFSSGTKGLVAVTISPDGRVKASFDNQSNKNKYTVLGTLSPNGKFSGRVTFRGADWGSHQGTFAQGPGRSLVAKLEETPNDRKESWGTYRITLKFQSPLSPAQRKPVPVGIVTGDSVEYSVTMTTTFVVPAGNDKIDRLRIYHALPTHRSWSPSKPTGAVGTRFHPTTAKVQHHAKTDSHHALWTIEGRQKPGTKHTFSTSATIRSTDRDVNLPTGSVLWKDYANQPRDKTAVVDPNVLEVVHPELAKLAAKFKAERPPPEAVRAMCKWIVDNIKYDASVTYSPREIENILRNRRGHCGHQASVLKQLTASAGIPMRQVFGLNLYAPDGRTSSLQAVRADYTNIHTWAEVYFPSVGWVELDPALGANAFAMPSRLIQNNRWFQNYAIWFREDGTEKTPTWTPRRGGFRSDYGVENIITYRKK